MKLLEKTEVIWEQYVSERICIRVWDEHCVKVNACVQVVLREGKLAIRVSSFGQTWTWSIAKACYDFFSIGLATFKICVEPTEGGVRVILQACLGSIKCWTLLAEDIALFGLDDLADGDLGLFGINKNQILSESKTSQRELLASTSKTMSVDEVSQLLANQ